MLYKKLIDKLYNKPKKIKESLNNTQLDEYNYKFNNEGIEESIFLLDSAAIKFTGIISILLLITLIYFNISYEYLSISQYQISIMLMSFFVKLLFIVIIIYIIIKCLLLMLFHEQNKYEKEWLIRNMYKYKNKQKRKIFLQKLKKK